MVMQTVIRDNITGKKITQDYYVITQMSLSLHSGQNIYSTFHVIDLDHAIGILRDAKNLVTFEIRLQAYHG